MVIFLHFELEDGEFVWNEHLQALVIGAFYWSYSVVQLFSGRLAEKIGTKVLEDTSTTYFIYSVG